MFCKNCGKQVPNDSTYCPYCGATLKAWEKPIPESQKVSTTVVDSTNVTPVVVKPIKSRAQLLSEELDKLGPAKVKKLLKFSQFFKISTILYFVSVLVFFASSPVLSIVNDSAFLKVFQIFLMVWICGLIGLSISNIVVAIINKKEFQLKLKTLIIPRSIYIALLTGLFVLLILRTIKSGSGLDEPEILIPTMVLTGLSFVTSGLNAGVSSTFIVLTPKRIAEANNWKKSQETISK